MSAKVVPPRGMASRKNKMRKLGAHAGAEVLWRALRGESLKKLHNRDDRIAEDVKASYAAFVRECASQQRKVLAVRGFMVRDDVPEMKRLLDHSRLQAVHKYRHKVELMSKSSDSNEAKSLVLLHNNPLPLLSGEALNESVLQYFDDTVDEDTNEEDLAALMLEAGGGSSEMLAGDSDDDSDDGGTAQSLQCVLSTAAKASSKLKDKGHYTFLTEADFRFPKGNFSKRRWDSEGNELMGPGNTTLLLGASKLPPLTSASPSQLAVSAAKPAHLVLTLDEAEEESKGNIQALGDGEFNRGKVAMWAT